MKKQKPIILSIPNPCNESWDKMSTRDKGKFCSHCQKTVTDITTMTDVEIVRLFQQQTDTHCIRAFSSQLNRKISLPTQAPTRFYKIAIALGLVLVSVSTTDSIGHSKSPLIEQNLLSNAQDFQEMASGAGDSFVVEGIVVGDKNKPIARAVLRLMHSSPSQLYTDNEGSFSINILKENEHKSLQFHVYAYGYQTRDTSILCSELINSPFLLIQLEKDLHEVIIMGGMGNVFRKNSDNDKIEEKDSLGHLKTFDAGEFDSFNKK